MADLTTIDILINLVLALITFSLGITLTRHDFSVLFHNPKSMGIGLFSQLVLLPFAAYWIMSYSNLDPVYKVGFFIIAICPGGVSSNLLSFMMNGNVALSISMTVFNSIITLFTIPFLTNIALEHYIGQEWTSIKLPFWKTFFSIFLVTVFPAGIGIFLRFKFRNIAKKVQPILRYVLPVLLLLIFSVKIFADKSSGGTKLSFDEFLEMFPAGILLNIAGMLLGYIVGSLFLVNFRNRLTIIVEVGLQNTAMALLIAGILLDNHEMEKPALVYAIFSFFSTLAITWLFKFFFFKWKKWVKRERHFTEY